MLCTQAGSTCSASYTHEVLRCWHLMQFGRSPEHLTLESRQGMQDRNVRLRLMPTTGSYAVLGLFAAVETPPFCTQSSCSLSQFRQPFGRSSHLT